MVQKLPIMHIKKTTKRGGGGQKLPILRRRSLMTAHKCPAMVLYTVGHGFSQQFLNEIFNFGSMWKGG